MNERCTIVWKHDVTVVSPCTQFGITLTAVEVNYWNGEITVDTVAG